MKVAKKQILKKTSWGMTAKLTSTERSVDEVSGGAPCYTSSLLPRIRFRIAK